MQWNLDKGLYLDIRNQIRMLLLFIITLQVCKTIGWWEYVTAMGLLVIWSAILLKFICLNYSVALFNRNQLVKIPKTFLKLKRLLNHFYRKSTAKQFKNRLIRIAIILDLKVLLELITKTGYQIKIIDKETTK